MLAGVVSRAVCHSEQASHRCDVDDASGGLLEHERADLAAKEKGTEQVDVEDATPIGCGRFFRRTDVRNPRIIHQNICPAEFFANPYGYFDGSFLLRYIARHFDSDRSETRNFGASVAAWNQVAKQQPIFTFGQQFSGPFADSLRRAGDDGYFAGSRYKMRIGVRHLFSVRSLCSRSERKCRDDSQHGRCAGHVQQLRSESLLSDLMEVKD